MRMKVSTLHTDAGVYPRRQPGLSELERAILLTVLYADLFDYALTEEELYARLVGAAAPRRHVQAATARLGGAYLAATQGYVVWQGREHLADLRRHRRAVAPELWATAGRYGRWLARVPFVRMVAVSGSLAVENAEARSDVDLFCITDAGRLWVARLFIVPLSKLTRHLPRRFPLYLCPNYLLALDALEVRERNLFTAHEVVQAVPLWGGDAFRRFADANAWVRGYLPHGRAGGMPALPTAPRRPVLTRACEALLRGRAGDLLDRLVHGLFVTFYRRRAERSGWTWAALAPAYQRSRYTVPEGGYVRVVRRLFAERVRERLGEAIPAADVEALFATPGQTAAACYDWDGLFRQEYGSGDAGTPAAPIAPDLTSSDLRMP